MNGYVLWIVIGVLVGAAIIFLVIASYFDRKKAKKTKIEKTILEQKIESSRKKIIIFLNILIDQNNELLKKFQPSIGKLKMGDIKDKAKLILKKYKHTEEFKLAQKDSENNTDLFQIYNSFEINSSNTWFKKISDELEKVKNEFKKIDNEFVSLYKKNLSKLMKEVY